MTTTRMTVKGQATIPKATRKNLNLKPNDRVEYINNLKNHTCVIRKAPQQHKNIFDKADFNAKNCRKFFKQIGMQQGQDNVGHEGWND